MKIKSQKWLQIINNGHMTIKEERTYSGIIPRKPGFMRFMAPERSGICLYFSEEIKEKREISVSMVKISKNSCRRKLVVV